MPPSPPPPPHYIPLLGGGDEVEIRCVGCSGNVRVRGADIDVVEKNIQYREDEWVKKT